MNSGSLESPFILPVPASLFLIQLYVALQLSKSSPLFQRIQLLIVGAVFESTCIPLLSLSTMLLFRTIAAEVAELNPIPLLLPYIKLFFIVGGVKEDEYMPSPSSFKPIMLFVISGEPDVQYIPWELLSSMTHLVIVGLDELLQDMPYWPLVIIRPVNTEFASSPESNTTTLLALLPSITVDSTTHQSFGLVPVNVTALAPKSILS